jgi:hypothetical protein
MCMGERKLLHEAVLAAVTEYHPGQQIYVTY